MSEEKENKEVTSYQLVQVPTQHTLAIQTPDGEVMSTEQAIVVLLNKVEEIKSVLG